MRIGVLTLPFNNNYGGLLQSYALQSYLKQRGHEVYSIQQLFHYSLISEIKMFVKNMLYRRYRTYPANSANMRVFQHNYMDETNLVYTTKDMKQIVVKYNFDALVVGSDQIWRFKSYEQDTYQRYFGKFAEKKNMIKVAFAASFGVDFFEGNEQQALIAKRLIKEFAAVSVREKSGIALCKEHLGYDKAIHLCDPTLLHSADFYRQIYTGNETDNFGKIGVYFLDTNEEKIKFVSEFEKRTGKRSVLIGKYRKGRKDYYPTPSQWLRDFDTVDYIITDSYHGMLFSIIFRKPFCAIGNVKRGLTRFISVLENFGLQKRLINEDFRDINYQSLLQKIDYSIINEILKNNIENSNKFFTKVDM
ncbi:MAG: polysaccharide pyruvyl transferase family protein [Prevotella sp.]|jgi:hypothetical protein|nr:polysaccharide pyruvyl transferase family protein [Prevotella sp.]